jgi:hypothetical protein
MNGSSAFGGKKNGLLDEAADFSAKEFRILNAEDSKR